MAPPRRAAILAAFAVIYVVWGTTYLGIRYAVEAVPPLLSSAIRFLLAGIPLYLVLRLRGAPRPDLAEWLHAGLLAFLMLALGYGLVSVAATRMPSGVAALLVATVPLWVTVLESGAQRRLPGPRPLAALAIGLVGAGLLSTNGDGWRGGLSYWHVAMVLVGSLTWAWGTVLSHGRTARLPVLQGVAMQMLAGGAMLLLGSVLAGETAGWSLADPGLKGWGAMLYLAVFGSLLALGCYAYLLQHVPASRVSTYAFVNPVIAVALGAVVAGEPVGGKVVLAAVLVITAVAMTLWDGRKPAAPRPAPPSPAADA